MKDPRTSKEIAAFLNARTKANRAAAARGAAGPSSRQPASVVGGLLKAFKGLPPVQKGLVAIAATFAAVSAVTAATFAVEVGVFDEACSLYPKDAACVEAVKGYDQKAREWEQRFGFNP